MPTVFGAECCKTLSIYISVSGPRESKLTDGQGQLWEKRGAGTVEKLLSGMRLWEITAGFHKHDRNRGIVVPFQCMEREINASVCKATLKMQVGGTRGHVGTVPDLKLATAVKPEGCRSCH